MSDDPVMADIYRIPIKCAGSLFVDSCRLGYPLLLVVSSHAEILIGMGLRSSIGSSGSRDALG